MVGIKKVEVHCCDVFDINETIGIINMTPTQKTNIFLKSLHKNEINCCYAIKINIKTNKQIIDNIVYY